MRASRLELGVDYGEHGRHSGAHGPEDPDHDDRDKKENEGVLHECLSVLAAPDRAQGAKNLSRSGPYIHHSHSTIACRIRGHARRWSRIVLEYAPGDAGLLSHVLIAADGLETNCSSAWR
jgi:hypothetical protein